MLVLINVIDKHLILRCIAPCKVSLLFCLFHSLLKVSVKKMVFINFFMYFYGNSYLISVRLNFLCIFTVNLTLSVYLMAICII